MVAVAPSHVAVNSNDESSACKVVISIVVTVEHKLSDPKLE